MAKFRKKPVVIEAVQLQESRRGSKPFTEFPEWLALAMRHGTIKQDIEAQGGSPFQHLKIETLEGIMVVSPLDWIIRGVKGELYPCKPDIFETTYEAVEGR